MTFDAVFTLLVLVVTTVLLLRETLTPDSLLFVALALLLAAGVIDLEQALRGFASPTLLAIGSMYVVAAGLRSTGALERGGRWVLGGVASLRRVLLRLAIAAAGASSILNNTPIVAMGVPAVRAWSRRHGVSSAKLLMPLSFASILGGLCTLIGTSTNLVTDGLLRSHGLEGLGFFELASVGVPCAIAGVAYLVVVSPHVLQVRKDVREAEEERREALVELEVTPESPLAGKTVREAGLERLPGLELVRVAHRQREIGPVPGSQELAAGDHLIYAPGPEIEGSREAAPGSHPGLRLALRTARAGADEGEVHEAVVREGSELVGVKIEDVGFLARFGAAVTGVRRGGERLQGPLGRVRLRPGDILMLDTGPGFRDAQEDSGDLYVATTPTGDEAPEEKSVAGMVAAVSILLGLILLVVTGVFHIAVAGLLGAVGMLVAGAVEPREARASIDWSVLLVIGTAFGIAEAMESSGAARLIGDAIVGTGAGLGPVGLLASVVLGTMLLTGFITNNAAAALMFPIALSVAGSQGIDPRPLAIGITYAASLSFWTPLGYQTNLMVYGPGNYRFTDFTRLGLPLQIALAALAVWLIPRFWPF